MSDHIKKHSFSLFTDGSSLGNPGPGGWGVLICEAGHTGTSRLRHITSLSGGEQWTTNNRMELTAAYHALLWCQHQYEESISSHVHISIATDSTYVHDGLMKYIDTRVAKKWKLANRKPVQNRDLWEKLYELRHIYSTVDWQWVKAHATNPYNNKVDVIARSEAEQQLANLPVGFVPPVQYVQPDNQQKSLFG